MADELTISNCRKACIGAGVGPITSLEDGSTESKFCNEWYELLVEAELSIYKWRFATTTKNLKTSLIAGVPDTKYNTAYQLPPDVLAVDTVMVDDRPIDYDRYQAQIHTYDSQDDEVIIKYRFRAHESLWNPYFRLLVIYRLATMLSFSVARKDGIASTMKSLADEHYQRAKTEDAQAQTNQKVNLQKLKLRRGGRSNKFWRGR